MENLFDLAKLGSQYRGYFVDREGKVYSNKQGALRALKISAPSNTFHKYWNLSTNGYSSPVRTDRFDNMLNRSDEYRTFVKAAKVTGAFAPSATAKGYIVGSVTNSGVSFSSNPKVHTSEASARTECERLASSYKGKTFMYVEIKGTVKASGFNWS